MNDYRSMLDELGMFPAISVGGIDLVWHKPERVQLPDKPTWELAHAVRVASPLPGEFICLPTVMLREMVESGIDNNYRWHITVVEPLTYHCNCLFTDDTLREVLATATGELVELPFSKAAYRQAHSAEQIEEWARIDAGMQQAMRRIIERLSDELAERH